MKKGKIEKIRISDKYNYDFDKYMRKEFLDDSLELANGDLVNMWQIVKNDYATKVCITTCKNDIIAIPLKVIFGVVEDWDLFSLMSVLEVLQTEINYEYYKIGEKYGKSEASITKIDNKIIKNIICIDNGKSISLKQFAENFIKVNSSQKLLEIVKLYFDNIDEDNYKKDELIEKWERKLASDIYRAENRINYSDDYYNDNLDLDQQSPEFWDNL